MIHWAAFLALKNAVILYFSAQITTRWDNAKLPSLLCPQCEWWLPSSSVTPKFAHITPVLGELHWFPVKFRVEFEIALLVFKTLKGLAPHYLSELVAVKPRTRYSLRSDYDWNNATCDTEDFWRSSLFPRWANSMDCLLYTSPSPRDA